MPLIEEGWHNTPIAKEVSRSYLEPFQEMNIDTLILGCTHYPIMAKTILGAVKNHVQLVYSGDTVGSKLRAYLEENSYKNDSGSQGETRFYVTDYPQKFNELGGRFFGRKLIDVTHISLL